MRPIVDNGVSALDEGRRALARGAWEEAITWLDAAVVEEPSNPEAWEWLANACNWLQHTDRETEARQRAYELYREQGDDLSSARVSLDLVYDFAEIRGEMAVANGWHQRARRLLENRPEAPEHVLLRIWDAFMVLDSDPAEGEVRAGEALAMARRVGADDLALLALALRGQCLVNIGRVGEGLNLLDEAVAGAIGREITDPQWFYFACCCMIDACDLVRDFGRSKEWCDQLREFAERWRIQAFLTDCRIKYTGSLLWHGDWTSCESELEKALSELQASRPAKVGGAIIRLAELRRRQGKRTEAEALLDRAKTHPLETLVRGQIALDMGDPASAVELADAALRRVPSSSKAQRVDLLDLKARAHVRMGDIGGAREAISELREISEMIGTYGLRATAGAAAALVAAVESDHERSRHLFEDAIYLFEVSGSSYEAARVRIDLAEWLAGQGRAATAFSHASSALATFESLDAALEKRRAEKLLAKVSGKAGESIHQERGRPSSRGSLTQRQREILTLVARGLSDRDIAEQLFLSEHTVHRHVANILGRLGVTSRTAAVAQAVRAEML